MTREPMVFVIDNDPGSVRSISSTLEQANLSVRSFLSAADFLREYVPAERGCIVLDLCMPELNGLAVLERLAVKGGAPPIIMLTGAGDVESCTRAFKLGVVDFLEKPVDDALLLDAVRSALAREVEVPRRLTSARVSEVLSQLTPSEKRSSTCSWPARA